MKAIKTETIYIPCKSSETLDIIFNKAEQMLIKNKKKILRIILLKISKTKAKFLVSFIMDITL